MRQFLLVIFLAAPASARTTSVTPEMDRLLMAGLDAIFQMDFDAADVASRKAIALAPEFPQPYLGAAAADAVRFMYGSEQVDESFNKNFEVKIELAISVAERWLKAHPGDADALLVLGSSYGLSARLAMDRRQWLKGWRHGSRAMKYIRASLKSDPEIYDSYLGLGMFDYYVDTIPRLAGWLAKLMLGGDRERGLQELRLAAEKGHYASIPAKLILVEVYTQDDFGALNPPEAVRLMNEIRAQYPNSPMLDVAGVSALYENHEMDAAARAAREYLDRVRSGRYPAVNLSQAHVLLGTVLWGQGKKEEALAEFASGAEGPAAKTRWTVWSRVRAGHLLDAFGRRAQALENYRAAYAEPDHWDFRSIIKPCLSRPCVGAKYPGHFAAY